MSNRQQTLETLLQACFAVQMDVVAAWHEREPGVEDEGLRPAASASDLLRDLVRCQHLMNYRLWHVEDTARRRDVDDGVIADCKRRIDGYNQRRNDFMEKVDECLVRMIPPPASAAGTRPRYNTESLGMAVDRLSILALKLYHMEEQTRRSDTDADHKAACAAKLATLKMQREDLVRSVLDLTAEFAAGAKQPKAYYQFKMYNDPALNPELYAGGRVMKG